MIRSFIAIELKDKETIENINSFTSRLKTNQPRIKLVEPENLHITVKFLGNIHEAVAPKIYNIIQKEINEPYFQNKIYTYHLKGIGQFRRFSVIWVKLVGDVQFLQKIKNSVEDLLFEKLNIKRDKRTKFTAHLTLARLKKKRINYKTFDSFKKIIEENKKEEFGEFNINQIKLKKSVLTPKGPIYSDLIF